MIKGIDVSQHQGKIDWEKVRKNGIDFAILRAGYGRSDLYPNQKDSTFDYNYEQAKKNNLRVGAYWYTYATTVDEIKKEALAFYEIIKNKKLDYPIFMDIEENKQFSTGKANVTNMVKAFCSTLESRGYFVGVYTSTSAMSNQMDSTLKNKYAWWQADWTGNKCSPQAKIHQYSSNGKVNGISGNVDMNYAYNDFPTTKINATKKTNKLTLKFTYKNKEYRHDFNIDD